MLIASGNDQYALVEDEAKQPYSKYPE